MSEIDTGCMGVDTSARTQKASRSDPGTRDGNGADHTATVRVGEQGELRLSEADRLKWGITPGAELTLQETPQGLALRPQKGMLRKVYVEPTSACNLDCRTCVRQSWNEPMGTMAMDAYRQLIAGLEDVPSLETMAFWGFGEPLLHPQIVEMIAMAKELGVRTEMISNGLLLTEEMARGLVSAGLDTLVISVDGVSPESYEDVRAGGSLEAVRRNVAGLVQIRQQTGQGRPEIGLEFVAMRRNVDQLPALGRLAHEIHASFVVVSNVLPYTEELKDEILYGLWAGRTYPARRTPSMPEILMPRIDLTRDIMEPAMGLMRQNGYTPSPGRNGSNPAGYCRFVEEGAMVVAWDGGISPCIALMHSYPCYVMRRAKQIRRYILGNVGQDEIAAVWSAQEYVAFRERVHHFDFAPCTECGGCNLSETNEEDCFGNTFPVCGDCLWARGVIQCP